MKSSFHIFGLSESDTENDNTNPKLLQGVLNVSCPGHNWQSDSITDAFIIGIRNTDHERIVIAKFKSADETHLIYTGRALHEQCIQISEEQTTRERGILTN